MSTATHHAQLYVGSDIALLPESAQKQTADTVHFVTNSWGIDDSRALAEAAFVRPVESDVRILVAQFETATLEAQNALLKILEEPPVTTRIYLVVPGVERLLPTVLSRLQVVETKDSQTDQELWELFHISGYARRLEIIAERTKAGDTVAIQSLLRAAIADTATPAHVRLLLDTYARTRGASRKMLLEEVALSLPTARATMRS